MEFSLPSFSSPILQPNPQLAVLAEEARTLFVSRFRNEPQWYSLAPGRVNLIGEHIDYNHGFVLPFAIERFTVVAAGPGDPASGSRIISQGGPGEVSISSEALPERDSPSWGNYVRGVFAGFWHRGVRPLPSINAAVVTSIPPGAGLSSSASLEMVFSVLINHIRSVGLSATELGLLAQKAEHDYAGVPCGIMDQFASGFGREGHVVMIDCISHEVEMLPFADPELSVLVVDSGVKHALADGEYARRREATALALRSLLRESWRKVSLKDLIDARESGVLTEEAFRRSRHVVTEISRTRQAAEALRSGSYARLGDLMVASHISLRDDYEVSCPELDTLVELAGALRESGSVLGARMTGGGFGGSALVLCRSRDIDLVGQHLASGFREVFGRVPIGFETRPGPGARIFHP